jgi:hypothetical protein
MTYFIVSDGDNEDGLPPEEVPHTGRVVYTTEKGDLSVILLDPVPEVENEDPPED